LLLKGGVCYSCYSATRGKNVNRVTLLYKSAIDFSPWSVILSTTEAETEMNDYHEQTCKELINLMCGERRSDERSERTRLLLKGANAALYNTAIFLACTTLIWLYI